MFDYVRDPEYMVDVFDKVGLCFGISYEEGELNEHTFHMHFDDQDTSGYKNIPNQKNPAVDPFSTALDADSFRHYTRQGFNLMQNWCANVLL